MGVRGVDRRELRDTVEELKSRLGLRDWTIELGDDVTHPDSVAEIVPYPHQRRAVLAVGVLYAALPDGERRATLVHELVHCHLFDIQQVADELLVLTAGSSSDLAMVAVNAAVERATDALTQAFVAAFEPPGPPRGRAGTGAPRAVDAPNGRRR